MAENDKLLDINCLKFSQNPNANMIYYFYDLIVK